MDKDNDDIIFDEVDGEGDEMDGNPANLIKKLREKIKQLQKEKEEYLTGWQKERAESVNLRKRFDEEKKSFINFANEQVVEDLIPTLDNFDMAMKNKEVWNSLPSVWTQGIEYIYSQLLSKLERYGVTKIQPNIGDTFDPNIHEALETIQTEEEEKDHTIIDVVQSGYKLKEKIIRPAKVKIGEYTQN